MPLATAPPQFPNIDLDGPSSPLWMPGDEMSDAAALVLVKDTFRRLEMWRSSACDQRWRLNEWLYYGYVQPRTWEGTSVPRSSISDQLSFDQVEAAHARLCNELFGNSDVLSIAATGTTQPWEVATVRDRVDYILDHNLDDYGWSMQLELEQSLKDDLIYGNCYGLLEWDFERKQAIGYRLDPRDVYVDPGSNNPYIERSRATIVRRTLTVDEVDAMRKAKGFNIPPKPILNYLAQNREAIQADTLKSAQEAARGQSYQPPPDDWLPLPSSRMIDVFVFFGRGREIWTLGNQWCAFNQTHPFGCSRIVSAPCFPVPNRHYAQSLVDVLDGIQQTKTSLLNWHLDEMALAMRPPRATKRGVIRTPSSLTWRPGLVNEFDDPQKDQVVYQPQGVTSNVWQTLGYLDDQATRRSGQSGMAIAGIPTPSNANRTRGGVQAQQQGSNERLSRIASNFERYYFVPMIYKMLKIEHEMGKRGEPLVAMRRPKGVAATQGGY